MAARDGEVDELTLVAAVATHQPEASLAYEGDLRPVRRDREIAVVAETATQVVAVPARELKLVDLRVALSGLVSSRVCEDDIGAATARALAAEGATVIAADVDSGVEPVAAELGDTAGSAVLDVRDAAAWDEVVEQATGIGPLGVLVNCAGIATHTPLLDLTKEEYRRTVETNQFGVFLGMRAAGRAMRSRGGGAIVNVASIATLADIRPRSPTQRARPLSWR